MATTDFGDIPYTYRAIVKINDIELDGLSFIALNESYDVLGSLFPLKILLLNVEATLLNNNTFIEQREVTIKLTLFETQKNEKEVSDPEYKYEEKLLYNDKLFRGYIDNEFIPLDNDEMKTMKDNDESPEVRYMLKVHLLEQYPHPFVKDVFNCVTNKETPIANLISAAFLKCSHKDLSLFMDISDNKNKIPANTLIEPKGFIQLINYIQENYGIYSHGFNTYIQDDICYILSKRGLEENEVPTYMLRSAPMTSPNVLTTGYKDEYGDNIYIDRAGIAVNDLKHEYYSNDYSRITEDGSLVHPQNKDISNVSLIVNSDTVQSVYNNQNIKNKLRYVSIAMKNVYLDFKPKDIFQIETSDMRLDSLSLWSWRRVVTPSGCNTKINIYRRTT